MWKHLLVVWACLAVAFAVTEVLVPSVEIEGGLLGPIGVSALFGLVNAIIGPVLRLLALPLMLVTFGLFALLVNAVLLLITAGLADALDVGGPVSTVVAALLVSVISAALGWAVFRVATPRGPAVSAT